MARYPKKVSSFHPQSAVEGSFHVGRDDKHHSCHPERSRGISISATPFVIVCEKSGVKFWDFSNLFLYLQTNQDTLPMLHSLEKNESSSMNFAQVMLNISVENNKNTHIFAYMW